MINYEEQFPILKKYTYANTASTGLIPKSAIAWRNQHDREFLEEASNMRMHSGGILSDTRKTVATFFGASLKNVALLQNFTLGLNILLEGLAKDKKVLLLEDDYPSLNWSFENRGFTITYCKINRDLERNIKEKLESGQIDILALSLVQWVNGIKVDLDFLKELKRAYPQLLIIADGTQFCGTQDFDFNESGLDVLGSSAYKWLLSGFGNGFMLFKDSVKEWANVETIGFNAADLDPARKNSIRFAKHFEPGHLDSFNFGTLNHSLGLLQEFGKNNIADKLERLSTKALTEFAALDLLDGEILYRKNHSTIFNVKGDTVLFDHLTQNNVLCSQRGNGIRFSFHFYNKLEDIDRIIEIINKKM